MKINTVQTNSNQNFKAVQLSRQEELKARRLIEKITSSEYSQARVDSFVSDIFGIFDKHIQKEAKNKLKPCYIAEDFLQEIYLQFFITLQNIKKSVNPFEAILDSINNYKASKNVMKPEYMTISLDANIFKDNEKVKRADMLTEERLPVYSRPLTEEENIANVRNLNEVVSVSNLTERQLEMFNALRKGGQQKDIANELGISAGYLSKSKKISIAKIQQANNVLPEDYQKVANELKSRYKIPADNEKIVNAVIKGELTTLDKDTLYNRIKESSKVLGMSEESFVNLAMKQTILFHISPQVLRNNITSAAGVLKITEQEFIKMMSKQPSICSTKPETMKRNLEKSAKTLGLSEEEFKKCILKHPPLLGQTSEVLDKNVTQSAQKLGVRREQYIKCCLRYPTLFSRTSDSMESRIEEYAKILNVEREKVTKYIMKAPSLLTQLPATILKNVQESANLLGITREQFLKCASNAPTMLYLSPQTIFNNVKQSAELLGVSYEEFLKCALYTPTLFMRSPQALFSNIQKLAEISGLPQGEVIKTALHHTGMFMQKPENIMSKHKILDYYKLIQGKTTENSLLCGSEKDETWYVRMLSFLVSKNDKTNIVRALKPQEHLVNYLNSNLGKSYKFEIPDGEVAKALINFSEDFSKKTIGKNIFEFAIKK